MDGSIMGTSENMALMGFPGADLDNDLGNNYADRS